MTSSDQSVLQWFLRWWSGELRAMLPRAGAAHAKKGAKRLVLSVESGRNRLILERAGRSETLAELALLDAAGYEELARIVRRRSGHALGLRLGSGDCFSRIVDLPTQAEGNFGRILQLDMERTTPFRVADVLSAHYPDPGATPVRGRKAVRHVIVKRRTIDPILAGLRRGGVEPSFADCWDETGAKAAPVNFLAEQDDGATSRRGHAASFAALAFALIISAGAIVLVRHQQALASLSERTAEARTEAAGVRQTAEAARGVSAQIEAMRRRIAGRMPVARVIEELTVIMPDSAFVTDLRIDNDLVEFTGFAKSAASLVPLLEKSPLFSEASLTSPVVLDDNEDKERFSMRLRLAGSKSVDETASTEADHE